MTHRPSALHSAIRQGANGIVQYLADRGAGHAAQEAEFEAPASTIELLRKLTLAAH